MKIFCSGWLVIPLSVGVSRCQADGPWLNPTQVVKDIFLIMLKGGTFQTSFQMLGGSLFPEKNAQLTPRVVTDSISVSG